MKQFNLTQQIFDDLVLVVDEKGQPLLSDVPSLKVGAFQYTTHGKDWFRVETQAEIDGISASITGDGYVWEENGKIRYSGRKPNENVKWDKLKKQWIALTKQEIQDNQQAHLAETQAEVRLKINAKRDEILNGGCYVQAIDKFVDTDEKALSNYLQMKADFDLNGKDNVYPLICADYTIKMISFNEFKAVWDTVKAFKESTIENAIMHATVMLTTDKPEDYDYSEFWQKTYKDHIQATNQAKE